MTLNSVNKAVTSVVKVVSLQLSQNPEIIDINLEIKPNYLEAIKIATETSMQEMLVPLTLGVCIPTIIGLFFGFAALVPLLIGFILCGVNQSTAMCNTGSAWNSAKRIIAVSESGKGLTDLYKATVIGDTLGMYFFHFSIDLLFYF